ncbi:META domain-containing protein [uncultured Litoreibacter sp.]|uniref:META domain-containing protein n=1 Tax=uncultured Litoreibacter sp. TaxID=1392394 RepID=UPI00262E039D|nr:META domain-containing protein [uncultured Litoreibacter sp.]
MKLYPLIALAMLAACKDETISGYSTEGASWALQSIDGVPFKANATISFPETGKIAGEAPCNSYFGAQTVPYPWFNAEKIGSTRRACADLKSETQFFEALSDMTLSESVGDTLILSNDKGREMLFKVVN